MVTTTEDIIANQKDIAEQLSGKILSIGIARLYSQQTRIGAGQKGLKSWQKKEADDRLHEAEVLLDIALYKKHSNDYTWRNDLRRCAEIIEWLSIANQDLSANILVLLSAAAYQLSGFPARASGILSMIQEDQACSTLIKTFLKADFQKLLSEINIFWSQTFPENYTLNDEYLFQQKLEDYIIIETIRAFGIISSWFRWGQDHRINKAIKKIDSISKATLLGPNTYSWILSKLISEIGFEYFQTSLRKNVTNLKLNKNKFGKDAIERYLRLSFKASKNLAWPSQIEGLTILKDKNSFALCTPTGSGKTRVAELAILENLFSNYDVNEGKEILPVILYIVPKRALAAEVEATIGKVLRSVTRGDVFITSLYGGSDWGVSDTFIPLDKRVVLISTHEKAEALIRFLGNDFINRINLIILDEAHTVEYEGNDIALRDSRSRSLKLETLLNRFITRNLDKDFNIIALSAVAPGIEDDLARWVTREDDAKPITTPYRSTRQLVGRLLCYPNRNVQIRYDLMDAQKLRVRGINADDSPYIPEPFPLYPITDRFKDAGPEKKMRPHILWSAMNFASIDSSGFYHSVLISVPQQPGGYAEDFIKLVEIDWAEDNLPDFFNEPRPGLQHIKWLKCRKSCDDYFGKKSREYRLLTHGIILHHGKMPGIMSRLLIELVQEKIVNIVIATSTLTEGINLPFETIIIPSLRRAGNYINLREFTNLIGRAGRPGFSLEGRSLVAMDPTSDTQGQYGTRQKYQNFINEISEGSEVSLPKKGRGPLANLLKYIEVKWFEISNDPQIDYFINWLETTIHDPSGETNDAAEALDTLDGLLIEALEEQEQRIDKELTETDLELFIQNLWKNSFSYYSSLEKELLGTILLTRGKVLNSKIYPERSLRKKLYRTSLPPREGKILIKALDEFYDLLKSGEDYYFWDSNERVEYIEELIEDVQRVPSFSLTDPPRNANWQEILRWWLDPDNAPKKPSPTQVSKWYEYGSQNFSYRFNWSLGSIFSLILESSSIEKSIFERWSIAKLPWAVFWVKDLITWGMIDPVAVLILMRGKTDTRKEALILSKEYYEKYDEDEGDSIFNPKQIFDWFSYKYDEEFEIEDIKAKKQEFSVKLIEDLGEKSELEWHVLPIQNNKLIKWIDPAGYPLAVGGKSSKLKQDYIERYEFILKPNKKTVIGQPYI